MADENKSLAGKKIKPVPKEEKNIGIDTDQEFLDLIKEGASSEQLDLAALENFKCLADERESFYALIDNMIKSPDVKSILELFDDFINEKNQNGDIIWVESENEEIKKYITYLLKALQVSKKISSWAWQINSYGDCYVKLNRRSPDDKDNVKVKDNRLHEEFKEAGLSENYINEVSTDKGETLTEDVYVYSPSPLDKFTNYVEMVANPGEMFELVQEGKTAAYIEAPYNVWNTPQTNVTGATTSTPLTQASYVNYAAKKGDVTVYPATEFVHMYLRESTSRVPEQVELFKDEKEYNANTNPDIFKVRRGESLIASGYGDWRLLHLLEDSIVLSRATRSSIVRLIQVELGNTPREQARSIIASIKNLFAQKTAIKQNDSMGGYTNPGPMENTVIIPTRDNKGNVTLNNIGGDYDPKSLTDVEYFRDKFYGQYGVPKQFFGWTNDSTGFNGGTSLTIISSQFAKKVVNIKEALIEGVTSIINILLLDRGLNNYVNKFKIKMTTPVTQEEIDKRDAQGKALDTARNILDIVLPEMENRKNKLGVINSLLSTILEGNQVQKFIQAEIDEIDKTGATSSTNTPNLGRGGSASTPSSPREAGFDIERSMETDMGEETPNQEELPSQEETPGEQGSASDYLPSFNELGVDGTE